MSTFGSLIGARCGCHIIPTPNGGFTFVGSVPKSLCEIRPATRADIMGGRAFHGYKGDMLCAHAMSFVSAHAALTFANEKGIEIADSHKITP